MRSIASECPKKPAARWTTLALPLLLLVIAALPLLAQAPPKQSAFLSPQAALTALLNAASKSDMPTLHAIFGPGSDDIIASGDPAADAMGRERFTAMAKEKAVVVDAGEGRMEILLGKDGWPFPVPIVRDGKGWRFDSITGMEELVNRRIGRNELHTLALCHAFVDAQVDFSKAHAVPHYAQRFFSTEGNRDGLYWKTKEGETESPLGPLAARASAEGYSGLGAGEPQPYHGYLFKILTAQGPDAPGGEKSYLGKDGRMTGGFALVAWPVNWGVSGIMTFIVNRQGIVFQRDLGENTAETAKAMTAYNPGPNWYPVRD